VDGAFFGELSLVLEDESRFIKIVAVENSVIFSLKRADFQHILAPHPDLMTFLQSIVLTYLEKIPLLETICEEYDDALLSISGCIRISGMKTRRQT
jgi:CRP-like cAMP-binding protein